MVVRQLGAAVDFLTVLKDGPGATVAFGSGGTWSIRYNEAKINVNEPNDNRGQAGIIDWEDANGSFGAKNRMTNSQRGEASEDGFTFTTIVSDVIVIDLQQIDYQ